MYCMYFCLEACLSLAFHAILCPVRLLLDIRFFFFLRVAFLSMYSPSWTLCRCYFVETGEMVFELLQFVFYLRFQVIDIVCRASDSFFGQRPSALCWLLWVQIGSPLLMLVGLFPLSRQQRVKPRWSLCRADFSSNFSRRGSFLMHACPKLSGHNLQPPKHVRYVSNNLPVWYIGGGGEEKLLERETDDDCWISPVKSGTPTKRLPVAQSADFADEMHMWSSPCGLHINIHPTHNTTQYQHGACMKTGLFCWRSLSWDRNNVTVKGFQDLANALERYDFAGNMKCWSIKQKSRHIHAVSQCSSAASFPSYSDETLLPPERNSSSSEIISSPCSCPHSSYTSYSHSCPYFNRQ